MMKKFMIATAILFASATFAQETVHYDTTTYGPSDTVVHYDNDRGQEKKRSETNVPSNELYPQTKKD
jgi:hypothetical protein